MRDLIKKWWPYCRTRKFLFALATLVFVVFMLLSENNVVRWIVVNFEIKEQERVIAGYKKSIEDVERKRSMLDSNLDTLETFARENYYYHLPDEEVFICKEQ